jgi:flagellar biosynthesis GTPase FlhF
VTKPNPSTWTAADYEEAALAYMDNLPLEHFMEGVPQATQREITLHSFAVLKGRRPTVSAYNELLVQFFHKGNLRQVVPDNFLTDTNEPCAARLSFNAELERVRIFWVLEYVSSSERSRRKDYRYNKKRYERELKVPYYLTFDPERQDLRLHRLNGERYERVAPNEAGRYPLPELEVEVGLLQGWVRYWYRGELIELSAVLQGQVDDLEKKVMELQDRVESQEDELRAKEESLTQQAEKAARERERAEQEKQRAEQEKQRAEQEKQQRAAAEVEVARLRALVEQLQRSNQSPT